MNLDLTSLLSSPVILWIIAIIILAGVFVLLRYFLHIVMHILRLFWHGCLLLIVILLVLYLLRFFRVI